MDDLALVGRLSVDQKNTEGELQKNCCVHWPCYVHSANKIGGDDLVLDALELCR